MAWFVRIIPLLVVAMLLVACGGGGKPPEPTPTLEPTVEPTPDLGITTKQDVKKAVIQIISEGTFVQIGETDSQSSAGSGSGFIISSEGIAITNNHVVSGAALIKVYIGGDSTPHNAKLLGVSECSDLAVIDIDGGGYNYLKWYEGDITAGLDVYTAGFPLGDPEYTITKGVISKEKTSGDSSWASVEHVLEHDATIRPGNSGGPLVDEEGRVVGINFAGREGGPYYAIGRDEAQGLVDQLRAGEDVNTLGINGQAFEVESGSGIWVSSVKSGSPMDDARVKPGDIITKIEGLAMGSDGTMENYCQILRTHKATDTLSLEVYRPDKDQVLEGQINGRKLEAVAQPATPTPAPTATSESTSKVEEITLTDAQIEKARQDLTSFQGQLSEQIFETFDRGNTTRNSWPESEHSILRDNYYRLRVTDPKTIQTNIWKPNNEAHLVGTSYIVEVDTAFDTGGQLGAVGLVFDEQDGDNYLSFVIYTDNTWQVIAFKDGDLFDEYTSTDFATDTISGDRPNNLRVERLSDGAILWINNTPVGIVNGSPFSGGEVGVAAVSGQNVPIDVIVDNFRLLSE